VREPVAALDLCCCSLGFSSGDLSVRERRIRANCAAACNADHAAAGPTSGGAAAASSTASRRGAAATRCSDADGSGRSGPADAASNDAAAAAP
jgi:hypothetical protein